MNNRLAIILALIMALLPAVSATIDLIGPADGTHTGASNVTFDYYNGVEEPISCTLDIPPQNLPDVTVQQGINAFIVQGIDAGTYTWKISCQNSTTTQTSEERTLIIDYTPPVIQLTRPDEPASELTVRLLVTDDNSNTLSCTLHNNNTLLDTISVTEGTYAEHSYAQVPGEYELLVTCTDEAGNTANVTRTYEIEQNDYLILTTDKTEYGLGEEITLTIDAPADASMTIDICPDKQGFVECVSPLILPDFPQTIQLPLNQSGDYLVEGIMNTPRGTTINSTAYTVKNTMGVTLATDEKPRLNEPFTLRAITNGAIGSPTYTWEFHNGTTQETTSETTRIIPKTTGVKTETVTVVDEAGNTKVQSITYAVEEDRAVTIKVVDDQSKVVPGATVQVDGIEQEHTTAINGTVQLRLELGTNKLYAGKTGYNGVYTDVFVNENTTQAILTLARTATATISVEEPIPDASYAQNSPVVVKFTVNGLSSGACTFYMAPDNESFLEQQATLNITTGQLGFSLTELALGRHAYMIECEGDKIISTEKRFFTVTQETQQAQPTSVYDDDLDAERELFEQALETMRSLGAQEQELIATLELEGQLNTARKKAGQLARDIFDMRYRTDLNEGEITTEQNRLRNELDSLTKQTIISVELLDHRTIIDYVTKEEIQTILDEDAETLGVPATAVDILDEAQQRYTMNTKLYRAKVKFGDGRQQIIAVVAKQFAYGQDSLPKGDANERLIEVIPKAVARSAKDIIIITDGAEVLKDDPILAFPAGKNIIYYVEEDLSLSVLEDVRTILIPEIRESNHVTGFAFLGQGTLTNIADKLGVSLSVLIALLIAGYLSHYFGLVSRVKYFFYQGGPKTKLHYVRVLLNDVHDNLEAGSYDKALMIYKEIKLTYDQLETPAKNELYDEIMTVCAALDKNFMKQLVVEMDDALKHDKLDVALERFARIEATYERLPTEDQKQVHDMVLGLGKRLGLEVPA